MKRRRPPPRVVHRRPPQDERIICMNLGMIAYAAIQLFVTGAPPSSVNAKAFQPGTNWFYLGVLVVASALVLGAAVVRSQYTSFSLELVGCLGLTYLFAVFAGASWHTTTDAAGTQSFAWSVALSLGNGLRCLRIVRRLRGLK